jgi:hypothetical protein
VDVGGRRVNAGYYARYSRAVHLAGLERNLTPLEVSIILVLLDEEERGALTPLDRLTPMLGLQVHPAGELRGMSIAGLLNVDQQRDGTYEVSLTDRGQRVGAEIRSAVTEQLQRWVALIRVAA